MWEECVCVWGGGSVILLSSTVIFNLDLSPPLISLADDVVIHSSKMAPLCIPNASLHSKNKKNILRIVCKKEYGCK